MDAVPFWLSANLYSNVLYSFRLNLYNPLEDIYSNYCVQECILKKTWKVTVFGQAISDAMYLLYRSNAAQLCKRELGCSPCPAAF